MYFLTCLSYLWDFNINISLWSKVKIFLFVTLLLLPGIWDWTFWYFDPMFYQWESIKDFFFLWFWNILDFHFLLLTCPESHVVCVHLDMQFFNTVHSIKCSILSLLWCWLPQGKWEKEEVAWWWSSLLLSNETEQITTL